MPTGRFDTGLFHRLKTILDRIVSEGDVPPYAVFHSFGLQEMATSQPKTLTAMAECYGATTVNLERHGERFQDALKAPIDDRTNTSELHQSESQDLPPGLGLCDKLDAELFNRLTALRLSLAEAEGRSPLAVFPDRTLKEMAILLPITLDALAECHGVGPDKLKRYGARFLEEIRAVTGTSELSPEPILE